MEGSAAPWADLDVGFYVEEATKARGKVLVKKTQVGTLGWMAQFATPDGCYLSLWQAAPRPWGEETGAPVG